MEDYQTMKTWKRALHDCYETGKLVGATTATAAAVCGALENRNVIAPINAISHIVWGDKAVTEDRISPRYTAGGLVLNTLAAMGWALLYEKCFGDAAEEGNVQWSLLGGALVAATAYVTDYHIVPKRLTPGLEKRLSNRSLLAIYLVLALSLGLGGLRREK
jgi:hypothetical protein